MLACQTSARSTFLPRCRCRCSRGGFNPLVPARPQQVHIGAAEGPSAATCCCGQQYRELALRRNCAARGRQDTISALLHRGLRDRRHRDRSRKAAIDLSVVRPAICGARLYRTKPAERAAAREAGGAVHLLQAERREIVFGAFALTAARPVNAVLSFSIALLTHDCRSVESTYSDPAVGHRDRLGRPSPCA